MMRRTGRGGFTLIELLVVIAIIVVLVAILFPVFSVVRAKARRTRCLARLHQVGLALKLYRQDHGKFPGLPYYDTVDGIYREGLTALYPDYMDSLDALLCPEDIIAKTLKGQVNSTRYCSWNGIPADPQNGNWALTDIWYNYNGYDMVVGASNEVDSLGIDNLAAYEAIYKQILMTAYATKGLRWTARPRLENRGAPDNTIVTYCVHHYHQAGGEVNAELANVLRLSGEADGAANHTVMEKDPDGAGAMIAPWVGQLN